MNDWGERRPTAEVVDAAAGPARTTGVRPVSRPPLHAVVTERLRGMIVEGQLRPGERINELDLADRLEVSRTPLREALKILRAEGLIVQYPNRSAFVSRITQEETAELFEALAGVERLGGELAARRVGRDEMDDFRALHEEMFALRADKDRASYFELNDRIHRGFVELSGNARLVDFHAGLMAGATRIRFAAIQYIERWDASVAEHREILAALEARSPERTGKLIEQHVLETGKLACAILDRLETDHEPRRRGFDPFGAIRRK